MAAPSFPDVSPATRKVMQANKGKDTKPEMVVRRLVHGMGYRYRLHRKDLPGKPDLVFGTRGKAIFVHGCFWHQHPGCPRARMPQARQDYWGPKFRGNRQRDAEAISALHERGWEALTVWECEIADLDALKGRLRAFLGEALM